MLSLLPMLLAPVLVTLVFVFLALRLGFFVGRGLAGRWAFVGGGLLILVAAVWQAVKSHSRYADWFVTDAYPILDLVQFALVAAGLLMAGAGLTVVHFLLGDRSLL